MNCTHILLVEDNPADIAIVRESFFRADFAVEITVVTDGEDALDILRDNAKFSEALRPDLILLDLNLPRMGGFEVLEELKSDPMLHDIPVFILSVLESDAHQQRASQLSVQEFFTKPVNLEGYDQIVREIGQFLAERGEPARHAVE